VTDRIAIRPEIDFSRTKVTFERTGTSIPPFDDENTSTVVRPGVSALFYLGQVEQLRTYVSPRFVYVSTDTSGSDETTSYLVSGSFGAHYRPVSRFAIFGEMGIQWTRSTFRSAPLEIPVLPSPITGTTTLRNTGVSLRSGVGVVLYF
jgi:hypothetical protein